MVRRMKTRNGFVSNSSDSSFIVKKKYLTEDQIEKIRNHSVEGVKLGMKYAKSDPWEIHEGKKVICGETWMDNFDMYEFLDRIGVPKQAYVGSELDSHPAMVKAILDTIEKMFEEEPW